MRSPRLALACALACLGSSVTACSGAPAAGPEALPAGADEPAPPDPSDDPSGSPGDDADPIPAPDLLNPAASGSGGDEVPADATADEGATLSIRAKLTLEPASVLSGAETKDLRLQIRLENVGTDAIDAPWNRTTLLLDGKPLSEWKELRETLPQKSIAPKQAVEMSYQPSEKAVIKPGSYEFVLEVAGGRSEPAVLTVEQ
jgi:hypothetical protein